MFSSKEDTLEMAWATTEECHVPRLSKILTMDLIWILQKAIHVTAWETLTQT